MMKKTKKVRFSSKELDLIKKVKNDKDLFKNLMGISRKTKRSFASVKTKWTRLQLHNNIEPVEFKIDTTVVYPKRGNTALAMRVKAGIDKIIHDLSPGKGSIPVDKSMAGIVRRHLKENYPDKDYRIHKDINPKIVRIFAH